jgi:tetratricopeptide (TPR) repeat protein
MRLRIFISSPGDVPDERLRAGLVIDKLAQEFSRHVAFDVVRWEHEPLIASGHFQDALAPPSESDIVILILWSRLGTPLPEKTAVREYRGIDGRAPVTGTEWEYEDALKAARERGAPDLLAFRNTSPTPIDPRDPHARGKSIAQLDALDAFWRRHFADRGVFLAAYDEYATLEEFAARLEESLRKLIERRIKAQPATAATTATWLGSPFRGLQAYGFEHAPIFFGRDEAVAKAAEQLAANARAGTAFLLVSGASGSGKSSLVHAALLPRIMQPQRIEGIAFARRLAFRPGSGGDPILGLVEALTRPSDDPRIGLPELLAPNQRADDFAAHLRATPDTPGFVFAGALSRLTDAARASGHLLAFESAKLVLVVDQLEELFTSTTISAEDLRLFVRLVAGLARSGVVWVVATLRADFWHRAAEIPELLDLAQGPGRIDLAAPSPAELAEMIRKPAQAAGLAFETHAESGLGLDAVIAQDATASHGPHGHPEATSGILPLLSFVLDALHAEDVTGSGGNKLTFATYTALGGLQGAMSRRAEETIAALPDDAQAAVPRVLRMLVTIAGGSEQAVVARVVPLARFGDGTPARAVVDAFTAARLIVATGDHAAPTVRLAHEALIGHWERARQQFAADRRDLETRTLVEQQEARWEKASGRAKRQLLLRDPDLANAIDLSARWGDELAPQTRAFIAASRQRARRVQRLTAAAAVIFAVVALTASALGVVAYRAQQEAQRQRARAEQTLAAATETANGLIFDLAQRFRDTSGVPIALIKNILERAQALQEQLIRSGATPDLRRSQAVALNEIATTLLDQGDTKGAFEAADRARQITQELLVANPGDALWQRDLWFSYNKVGDVQQAQGDLPEALKTYQASLAIAERLAKADPGNADGQRDLSSSYERIGVVQLAQGNLAEAITSFQTILAIVERLAKADPGNAGWQRDLAAAYYKMGDVRRAQGNLAEAITSFQTSLAIIERIAKADPGNAGRQRDLATCYERIGLVQQAQGNLAEAFKSYQASHAIVGRLAKADPGNAGWQRDLSVAYNEIGDVQQAQGNLAEGLKSYQASLAIAERLAKADPGNAGWQRDLWISYNKVGDVQRAQGNLAEALKSYQAGLAIAERSAKAAPGNAGWQRDLSVSYDKVGEVQQAQGNLAEALNSYQASLAIAERLAKADPGNAGWQRDLAVTYQKVGDVQRAQDNADEALKSYQAELAIAEHLAKADPNNAGWQTDLVVSLIRIGAVSAPPDARAAFERAVAILEPLARDGKLTAAQQRWPQIIRDALAKLPK